MEISFTKLLIILVIALVIFGAGKLPRAMGDIGKSIRSLKDGLAGEKKPEEPKEVAALTKTRMLDFSFGELALIVLVALLIVGPKDLPKVMYAVGRWFGQFKSIAEEFKQGFKSAMHETQLADIEKDLKAVHEDIQYIRDSQGNVQRIYDISDFLDEKERSRVTIEKAREVIELPQALKTPEEQSK